MGWFAVLILGIIAAVIAKLILRQRVGWFLTIVLGVIGALLGGWISQLFFGQNLLDANGFWSLVSWFWAVLGALIVIGIYGALAGRRR
ncbi:MAG: GlsB/YeaQ/YmgE family stress response membrane protein [Rhodoglobus sp.]|jgi:uncharacterized membrane protein YeaQ/YmgE (transglycosylase-associated protein family)|nr:GlsB/YeaQ/YmgE family stress response membrane protein [Rhodoglobus sp.]